MRTAALRAHYNFRATCWIVVGLGLVLFATGCARRSPLELRVRAETPYEFLEWQERVMTRQPASVAAEFKEAVARIVACSPTRMSLHDERMMHRRHHPICRELDGRTVREVIIAGYVATNEELLRGMILQSNNLIGALQYEAAVRAEKEDAGRVERMIDRRSAVLGTAKAQVAANRRRIAELEQGLAEKPMGFFVRFALWRVLMLILP